MIDTLTLISFFLWCAKPPQSLAVPLRLVPEQSPLVISNGNDIRAALKEADIISDVLDDFTPSVSLSLSYPSKHVSVNLGNTLSPSSVASAPILEVHAISPSEHPTPTIRSNTTYTIALTDPDATSRSDPVKAEMCHWIVTGISLPSLSAVEVGDAVKLPSSLGFSMSFGLQINSNITEIMPYFAPSPPPKTGLHRYVFVLLGPSSNEDSGEINLKKPKARPHWGYKKIGKGVKKWAKDNELKVIGANFFYAENKKQ